MSAVRREFPLPDLGEGLTGAEIVRWLVRAGDRVEVDQPLVEVETAKTRVEIPSPYAGEVLECRGAAGEELPVGAPLVVIAEEAGPGGGAPADGPVPGGAGSREPAPVPGGTGPSGTPPAEPAREEAAGAEPVLVGYGTRGAAWATSAAPAPAPAASPPREGPVPVVSPLVRRLARDHGIDLRTVSGTGPAGLVGRSDVLRAVTTPGGPAHRPDPGGTPSAPSALPAASRARPGEDVLVWHGAQRAAATKVTDSHREIPAATCWLEADATGLLDLCRASADAASGPRVGVLALIARMCVAALGRHPALGSRVVYDADGRAVGVRPPESIGLGIATRTDRGVVVPVVHDAARLTTARLAEEIARLTAGARNGTLAPHELTGGCFTLNNHGVLGTDGAVPLINHPETAMLGVGRIARRPWVEGDAVVARSTAPLSLTFDHRVCDGATAADFLRLVARAVTSPGTLAVHL